VIQRLSIGLFGKLSRHEAFQGNLSGGQQTEWRLCQIQRVTLAFPRFAPTGDEKGIRLESGTAPQR
jgi:hypothetical protein